MNNSIINILCKIICSLLFALGIFFLRSSMMLNAQSPRPTLEKLAKGAHKTLMAGISPNGRYAFVSTADENTETTFTISDTQDPQRKLSKKNVSKHFFISKDILLLLSGNTLTKIELPSQKELEIQHVKNIEFLESGQLLLHYDGTRNNLLEILDRDFSVRQQIGSVIRWQNTEDELIVFQNEGGKKNLLKVSGDGKFYTTIWSSVHEVYTMAAFKGKKGEYIVGVSTPKALKTFYVRKDLTSIELNDPAIMDYDHLTINSSSDRDAVLLRLSKKLPLNDELVSIWYGNKKDLGEYIYNERVITNVLWYPKENLAVILDPNFTDYTAVGLSNMFLRVKIDRNKVDIKDGFHGVNEDEIHLWNSKTGVDHLLGKDGGYMYFDKEGKNLLFYSQNHWKILNTDTLGERRIDMPGYAEPYFSSAGTILWCSKGDLWEQNLSNLKNKKLLSVEFDNIEILNKVRKSTEAGLRRMHQYVDRENILILASNENSISSTYFAVDTNKKIEVIPETTDRIQFFKTSEDGKTFVWTAENYNKTPVLMSKDRSSPAKKICSTNTEDHRAGLISKKILHYKGVNNEDLRSTLFLPPDFDAESKYPVVLSIYEKLDQITNKYVLPTFKNTKEINVRFLLESGYLVLLPDINYGEAGPVRSALYCINNVLDELQKVEQADMKRVGLMGQSFGGYETNFIATQSDRFAAYISGASVADLIHLYYAYNYNFKSPDYYRIEEGQFRMFDTFENNKQKYFDNNPLYHASKVKAPMLLWTGTHDQNIQTEETRSFYNALRKYRKPVVALFYTGEGHSLGTMQAQRDFTLRALDWFDYFLQDKQGIPWIDKQMKDAL